MSLAIVLTALLISHPILSAADMSQIDQDISAAESLIKTAASCLRNRMDGGPLEFCTGLSLDAAQAKELMVMSRDRCLKEIKKSGYSVADKKRPAGFPVGEWNHFNQSLNRATTFHDHKTVAFNTGSGRIDCIHELIHVYQWARKTNSGKTLLSKEIREKIDLATRALEREIAKIADLERKGSINEAKAEAQKLQPFIDRLKQASATGEDIDEIEVHGFIYDHCQEMGCGDADRDMALANLNLRASMLPQQRVDRLQKDTEIRRIEKISPYSKKAQQAWKPLTEAQLKDARSLIQKDWEQLIQALQKDGLRVIGVRETQSTIPGSGHIPKNVFDQLPMPESESDAPSLKSSKISKGLALGKFVCSSSGKPTVFLTSQSTKGTIVHEYLHFLQSRANPGYCRSGPGQEQAAQKFSKAQINRSTYEKIVLGHQAVNAVAEIEVYAFMVSQGGTFNPWEQLNNSEMLSKYQKEAGIRR